MSSLRLATASNVRAFQNLTAALSISDRKWIHAIDQEALEDEIGRFRVWAGNLGALQKGHSSLDYRLRDSPVSSNNILKLLQELETNVSEAYAVASGARLPYEEQAPPALSDDDDNDDGFFSADSDDENSSSDEPRTELHMRFQEIVDIIDNLYKLSVRIRTPGLRSRSLKASSYTQKDPKTGIDLFDMYAAHDLNHVQELVAYLRQPYAKGKPQEEQDFLIKRLSTSITLRRRHFKYWKRHRDKLSKTEVADDDVQEVKVIAPPDESAQVCNDGAGKNPTAPIAANPKEAPSQKTGKTLLSGTDATQLHQSLDDIVDSKSVTSYAVTVKDVHGKSIDLPPPPRTANGDKDFECPYCWIICPSRYSKGRAWRTHLLQDLQPYCCTYLDCESSHLLFRSRREWAEHEASHRKVWRCPEHPDAVFNTQSGLENHLRQRHLDSFPESQLENIAKIGEATTVDMRAKCPICCAPADTKELGDLQNHIANHLERIATFSLPHSNEDDSDGTSGIASPGSTSSRSLLSSVPASADMADEQSQQKDKYHPATLEPDSPEPVGMAAPSHDVLSTENLQQLPDMSRDTLDKISELVKSHDMSYSQEKAQLFKEPAPIEVNDIPTLSSLYRSRQLLQTDQSYAANNVYNGMISLSSHDLTKLKVDAIVNNAPLTLVHTPPPGTLHHIVVNAGGPLLLHELGSKGRLNPGNVTWTRGYNLPSSYVIHAAAPTFVGVGGLTEFNLLGDCYFNALDLAAELKVKTIAFPCLGTGGGIFPPRQAARTALQAVRDYLDANSESRLERIVFCSIAAGDRQAYMDFIPAFFPPTHNDLDRARGAMLSPNPTIYVADILYMLEKVQRASTMLKSEFCEVDEAAQRDFISLQSIDDALHLMRKHSEGHEASQGYEGNFKLLSTVLSDLCDHIMRMAQKAKESTIGTYEKLRMEVDQDMHANSSTGLSEHLSDCLNFALGLIEVLKSGKPRLIPMEIRSRLEHYSIEKERETVGTVPDNLLLSNLDSGGAFADKCSDERSPEFNISVRNLDPDVTELDLIALFQNKYPSTNSANIVLDPISGQSGGYGFVCFSNKDDQQKALVEMQGVYCGNRPIQITYHENNSGQLDEATSVQDATSTVPHRQGLVKLHQIPSVARIYQLGAIEAKPTLAVPSASFNEIVCLIKEDITRLEVDVIVNITNTSFLGMGTLDRSIFKKGGPELQSELAKLGEGKIGDVVTTPGYLLPAKHILHVVPPRIFRSDTKKVLRNIYREILLKATYLNAKSVAIPCIGLGLPRDCASLAMEEVRRFLQSKEPGGLEKIIFTVYSFNNESIYRGILPVYFPPAAGSGAASTSAPMSQSTTPMAPASSSQIASSPATAGTTSSTSFPRYSASTDTILERLQGKNSHTAGSADEEEKAAEQARKDAELAKFARLENLLIAQQEARIEKDKAKGEAVAESKKALIEVSLKAQEEAEKAAFEAKRTKILQSYVTSDKLPTPPPAVATGGGRGRGGRGDIANQSEGQSLGRADTLPSKPTPSSGDSQFNYPEQTSQTVSDDEPLAMVIARVSLSEFGEDKDRPLIQDMCTIRVHRSSIAIFRHPVDVASPPLLSFSITPDIEWDLEMLFCEVSISEVQRDGAPPGDKATVFIRCNERGDVHVLAAALERVIDQAVQNKEGKEKEAEDNVGEDAGQPLAEDAEKLENDKHVVIEPDRSKASEKELAERTRSENFGMLDDEQRIRFELALDEASKKEIAERIRDEERAERTAEGTRAEKMKFEKMEAIHDEKLAESVRQETDVAPFSAPAKEKDVSSSAADGMIPDDSPSAQWNKHIESPMLPPDVTNDQKAHRHKSPLPRRVECPDYKNHIMNPKSQIYPCSGCGVTSMDQVRYHLRRIDHRGCPSTWTCPFCKRDFNQERRMERHVQTKSCQDQVDSGADIVKPWAMLYLTRYPKAQRIPSPYCYENEWLPQSVWGECRALLEELEKGDEKEEEEEESEEEKGKEIEKDEAQDRQESLIDSSVTAKEKEFLGGTGVPQQRADTVPRNNSLFTRVAQLTRFEEEQERIKERGRERERIREKEERAQFQSQAQEKDLLDPLLSSKIITHLTSDLRSRPTSYIGQHINGMAAALDTDTATLSAHLAQLEQEGKVHTTVDGETWVVDGWEGEMKPVISSSSSGGDKEA